MKWYHVRIEVLSLCIVTMMLGAMFRWAFDISEENRTALIELRRSNEELRSRLLIATITTNSISDRLYTLIRMDATKPTPMDVLDAGEYFRKIRSDVLDLDSLQRQQHKELMDRLSKIGPEIKPTQPQFGFTP